MMSADNTQEDSEKFLACGIEDIAPKPVSLKKIEEILNQFNERDLRVSSF